MTATNESIVSEASFRERLDRLRASYPNHDDLIRELERFVCTAPDDGILRINPIQYAADHGRDEAQIVDLFLHARKAGLLIMEWHYVCRGCGTIIESLHTLNAAGEHVVCKTCLVNRDTDLSDFVEIAFTVSKAVRTSRFHDPSTLSAKELFIDYNISASALARDGTKARDFYWRHSVFLAYVEPGETRAFQANLEPGFFSLRYGPEFMVDPSSDHRVERVDTTQREGRPGEKMQTVAPRTCCPRCSARRGPSASKALSARSPFTHCGAGRRPVHHQLAALEYGLAPLAPRAMPFGLVLG
jgi:hypothetical protein